MTSDRAGKPLARRDSSLTRKTGVERGIDED